MGGLNAINNRAVQIHMKTEVIVSVSQAGIYQSTAFVRVLKGSPRAARAPQNYV